jgi:hypothetical protein
VLVSIGPGLAKWFKKRLESHMASCQVPFPDIANSVWPPFLGRRFGTACLSLVTENTYFVALERHPALPCAKSTPDKPDHRAYRALAERLRLVWVGGIFTLV